MQPEPIADNAVPRPTGPENSEIGTGVDTGIGSAPQLGVAAAARRLGVAPATLRTWDRRYGIGPSDHAPGRHRRYSPNDVARLELMQHALVRGAGPAEAAAYALAARLPRPDVDRPRPVSPTAGPPRVPVVTGLQPYDLGGPVLAGLDGPGGAEARVRVGGQVLRLPGAGWGARGLGRAALSLDAGAARGLLIESIATLGVEDTWIGVACPVLVAVADRWASTGAGVEIEHLLSECVIGVFGAFAAEPVAASDAADARPVLLAGMPGEQHMLPMVVLAAALTGRGVPCRSLGSDLPADALVAAIRRIAPVAVVLWSQLPPTADPDVLRTLPRTRPRVRTFVAGPGWAAVDLPPRVARLGTLAGAISAISGAVTHQ